MKKYTIKIGENTFEIIGFNFDEALENFNKENGFNFTRKYIQILNVSK